jgi:tight adherence protein B
MGVVVGLGVGVGLLLIWSAFTIPRTDRSSRPSSLRLNLDRAGLVGVQVQTVVALSVSLFVIVTLAILLLSSTWPVSLAIGA